MPISRHLLCFLLSSFIGGLVFAADAPPSKAEWKTAFFKRGFVGNYKAAWAGGKVGEGFLRMPVMMPFDGTQVRVWMHSGRDIEVVLGGLNLAPGVDRKGTTDGRFFPVTVGGAPGVTIEPKKQDFVSDESPMPIRAGLWYLQENYTSEQYLYAYDADGMFRAAAADQKTVVEDSYRKGSVAGNVYRIDVLTTDTRPVIVCYGDSITHGAYTTPNSGNRYPALLGGLINRPVLNLGVNGDLAKYARGMPGIINSLDGVDTVVFLMGINDIVSGSVPSADDYAKNISSVVAGVKQRGRKFYIGTITPAGGYTKFDADPAKETLRQAINAWIRTQKDADGVIDFDAALRDPKNPVRLRDDCQTDGLHPNDAGAQAMARAAAAVLK